MRCCARIAAVFALSWPLLAAWAAAAEPLTVAAASSLRHATDRLGTAFTEATGEPVRFVHAASGKLRRQLHQGAPYGVFLAANRRDPAALAAAGRTAGEPVPYATGHLALVAGHAAAFMPADGLPALAEAVRTGSVTRVAIAHPGHAPYGQLARAALRRAGIWTELQPVLVRGENAAQAVQFVQSGAAPVGLVPAAQARAPTGAASLQVADLAAAYDTALTHHLVVMEGAGPMAERFAAFMTGERAQVILADHGFGPP